MTDTKYAIKHKTTGLFFGGFDDAATARWVCEGAAVRLTRRDATLQAALFASHSINVQRKPVAAP